jgi:hypothetical protein
MNYIQVEGSLEDLRKILAVAGVKEVGRGVRPLADGSFRAQAYVQEAAIPLIEALGVRVTVMETQAGIDQRLAQVAAEQNPVG